MDPPSTHGVAKTGAIIIRRFKEPSRPQLVYLSVRTKFPLELFQYRLAETYFVIDNGPPDAVSAWVPPGVLLES
jgi:hypothetical protein